MPSKKTPSLWPTPKLFKKYSLKNDEFVTNWLANNFTNGYPILVSSGRSGLSLILGTFAERKPVNIFPFVNKCVLDAVKKNEFSCIKSDMSNTQNANEFKIIYYQWGYNVYPPSTAVFVEDRVDSFYKIGSSVRTNGGRFEIWSLNKILGTSCGGVIWCASKEDFDLLLEKKRSQDNLFLFLKPLLRVTKNIISTFFYKVWNNFELENANVPALDVAEISHALLNWDVLYRHRLAKIEKFLEHFLIYISAEELNLLYASLNSGILPAGILLDPSKTICLSHKIIALHRFYYDSSDKGRLKLKKINFLPSYLI